MTDDRVEKLTDDRNDKLATDKKIAELTEYVFELEKEVQLLTTKLNVIKSDEAYSDARCGNCALWDENDELIKAMQDKSEELRKVKLELDEYVLAEEKTKKRLLESNMEADRLNKTSQYKYYTELKTLKLLADKFKDSYKQELNAEKVALTDLLADFLKEVDGEGYLINAKNTLETLAKNAFKERELSKEEADFYGEDSDFDLEEAMNPTEELDLKSLLDELGVFGG